MKERPLAGDAEGTVPRSGWAVFQRQLDTGFLCRLRGDLALMYARRRAVQQRNGIAAGMEGTCHHLLGDGTAMDEFLTQLPLDRVIRDFFGGPYILNSFGGFINAPGGESGYIGRVHRDIRTYSPEFKMMLNMLVMLDDFTPENGATLLLPGPHFTSEPPSRRRFREDSIRLLGKAGDIVVFDSRLWHAAGVNKSTADRRALTLTYTRPFFKQQLDYPRFLGDAYGQNLTPAIRQVLGYAARVPDTIDAFYQPPERRAYQSDQG